MRNIGQHGLKKAYREDIGTRDILRQMMALCYLPQEYIERQFRKLKSKCKTATLRNFAEYFENTWICGWNVQDWCVFWCTIRTNNTLEGLNNKFNSSCNHNMPFYLLIEKMHTESAAVDFDVSFVYLGLVTQRINPAYAGVNQKLFCWWNSAKDGDMAPLDLLKKCAIAYTPESI